MPRAAQGARVSLLVLLCALLLPAQTDLASAAAASSAPPTDVLTVPNGEILILELEDALDTRSSLAGDRVHFQTFREVVVGFQVAIPQGSFVQGTLTEVRRPGRAGRAGQIVLRFDEITLPDGTTLPFEASLRRAGFMVFDNGQKGARVKGEGGVGKRDAVTVAVGAGQGALLGVGLGGKKGAAYGGAIGAGVGLLEVLMRKGPHLDLPRGTFFEVELSRDAAIPQSSVAVFAARAAPTPSPAAPPRAAALPADTDQPDDSDSFTFPDEPSQPRGEEPLPDFPQEPSAEIAVARPPETPPAALPELPPATPPPTIDPSLGDPGGYKMKVDGVEEAVGVTRLK